MSDGMRVLMTLDAVGGVWRYAMDLAQGLRAQGTSVAFLGFGPGPSARQREEGQSLGPLDWADEPLDWLAQDASELAGVPGVIARAARRHGADLLHLNLPSQAAGLETDRPVVVVSHSCVPTWFRGVRGSGLPEGWEWHHDLNARGLTRADLGVVPTRAHGRALAQAYYGHLPRLRVVANATAAPEGRGWDEPFALAIGRWWDEGKGGAALDAAAARTGWPVRMVGSAWGPNGAAFAARHAELLGERPHAEVQALIRRAGIFVAPSLYEPFGLAVAEAARMSVPLVLSDIGTFRELWEGAACFVPPGDAEALARTLDRLAGDAPERRRLGEAAQVRARAFTPAAQARAMGALYAELAREPMLAR